MSENVKELEKEYEECNSITDDKERMDKKLKLIKELRESTGKDYRMGLEEDIVEVLFSRKVQHKHIDVLRPSNGYTFPVFITKHGLDELAEYSISNMGRISFRFKEPKLAESEWKELILQNTSTWLINDRVLEEVNAIAEHLSRIDFNQWFE